MLAAMRERSFAVVTAIIKTEPVQVAAFGFLVLGDRLSGGGRARDRDRHRRRASSCRRTAAAAAGGVRPILFGIARRRACSRSPRSVFAAAILALDDGSFLLRATTTLAWGLGLQTAILAAWLLAFDRAALLGSLRRVARRRSLAGFLGALASQFWFIGFSLTAAANVRTLALVEVPMAQAVSWRLFAQKASSREIAGMALIVVGVGLLLAGH